ncbi:MAG: DUF5011 domain-containing protein, partial [Opitutae bacterium]|nr:DUF5011 domain-containing protein [Opitutae bacterium]
ELSGRDDAWLDLDFNGGLLEQTPKGSAVFKGGPLGVGINIETDAMFHDLNVGITKPDDFQILIHGVFRPRTDGDHTLGIDWPDDRGSFWVDLDQDGRFEVEGNLGNEWMNEGTQAGYKTVSLKRGEVYNVAVIFVEHAAGSRIFSYVTIPGHIRQIIGPVSPDQGGLWGTHNPIDVNTEGTYTINYVARDRAGNESTASRTIIVEEPVEPPVITLKGGQNLRHPVWEDFTDPGVNITEASGTAIDGAEPVTGGDFNSGATGVYTITYDFNDAKGAAANTITRQVEVFDNKPPVITLTGENEIEVFQGVDFSDPGVTATDNSGLTIDVATTADIPRNGLQLHLDASYFESLLNDGDPIAAWPDLSGNNRHATDTRGVPTLSSRAINGHPAVHLDANDFMATTHHFGNRQYSLLTVSQFDGGTAGRLISSRDVNYILGYWQGREDVAHLEGWVNNQNEGPQASTDPHLYTATNTGANHSQFYSDGVNLTTNASPNGRIGKIQFGGYQASNEPSSGYVAEAIIYDRVLTNSERLGVETYLNGKYGLNGHAEVAKLDVTRLGTYTITYVAADPSGNVATKTRVVTVVPDPSVPVITLNGDMEMFHEAGTDFTDPGAVAKDGEGAVLDDTLTGEGAVDTSKLGIYPLTYNYSTDDGKTAPTVTRTVVVVDNTGPVITLNGEGVIRIGVGEDYQDVGATAVDVFTGEAGVTAQSSNPAVGYEPGLMAGGQSGNMSMTSNSGSYGVDPLGPTYSESKASPPWAGNWTIVYTGQIYDEDGRISFTENIDDKAWLKVNGQELLNDTGWNRRTEKSADFGEGGWFDFELRISNGGGGAGVAGGLGFGYDPEGGNNYILPRNGDGPADLFRIEGLDPNSLNTSTEGTYNFTYTSADTFGNTSTAIRTIVVTDDLGKPYITLNGEGQITHEAGTAYVDPAAKAFTGDGTEANGDLKGVGDVDGNKPGVYSLSYSFDDGAGNSAEPLSRTVTVVDTTPPVITMGEFVGDTDFVRLFENQQYTDPGATGTDVVDGEVAIFTDLEEIPNALLSHAYTFGSNENQLDFSAETSLFNQQPNAVHLFRRELKFGDDASFRKANPGISRNDNFQNLWHGYFTAKRSGEFEFNTNRTDDRSTVWVDLDRDGIYEHDGDEGDERITWQNGGVRFNLEQGKYRVAIGHLEWGGGSSVEISLRTPEDAGPFDLALINPIDPEQEGIWSTPANPPVDTAVIGRRTIRYYAVDKAGNFSVAERVVIVDEDKMKPVIALLGDKMVKHEAGAGYKDDGVELYDYQGNKLDATQVVTGNLPDGSSPGEYFVTYDYTDAEGHKADQVSRLVKLPDTVPPVITLSGINPVTILLDYEYQDPGATAVDIVDGELLVSSNLTLPMHGMLGWWSFDDEQGTVARDTLGKHDAELINFDGSEWEGGQINGSLHFNSNNQNNQYMLVPSFEFGGAFSIAVWVQYDKTENWSRIIDFGHAAGNHNVLLANVGGGTQAAWEVRIGGTNRSQRANNFWEVNNWVHAAATVSEGGHLRVYKNGQQVAENANGHAPAVQTRTNHYVGKSNWGNDRYFRGYMDELILYKRAITPDEINRIMNGVEPLDTSSVGEHTVTYITVDSSGNQSTATRTVVIVEEATIPEISLNGDADTIHSAGTAFEDPGVTVYNSDGDEMDASTVKVTGAVDANKPGDYVLVYDFSDAAGNAAASAVRRVKVVDDSGPDITLTGGETFDHQIGNDWVEPGVIAIDGLDGEVEVLNSLVHKNQILHSGFMIEAPAGQNNVPESILNLDGNGGILKETSMGEAIFTKGPRGVGLYLQGDADFMNAGVGIDRNDKFQNLFTGHFHSKKAGVYEFGVEGPDDRSTFWIDLDGDGIFEADGDNGSEWINGGYRYNYREVELGKGYYKYAISHLEYGGGSRIDARFRAISGIGPRQRVRINPSDPTQDGLWVQYDPVNVKKKGEYTITYTAVDSAGNSTTTTRTVIVDSNPDAPVIILAGEKKIDHPFGTPYVDAGATVEDTDGNALDAAGLAIEGEVNADKTGEYILSYTFKDANGVAAKTVRRTVTVADATPPVITLVGGEEITHFVGTPFTDPGATALDNYDGELRVSSSELFPNDGLVLHLDAKSIVGIEDGLPVTNWMDLSSAGNHASDVAGEPLYVADGINGRPGVQFDGKSSLAVTQALGNRYTILTVSRLLGSRNARLLTSKDQNWLLGYHGNFEDCYHPVNGWVTDRTVAATANPHIYIASSTGGSYKRFWSE